MTTEAGHLRVRVWRGGETGTFTTYEVPARNDHTVLDVVPWIQRNLEPAPSYRFACRVGVCGSCAMSVNGRSRWPCRTHIGKAARDGRLTIEPLRNLPRIKDLVCDLKPFFDKWTAAVLRSPTMARSAIKAFRSVTAFTLADQATARQSR